MLSMLTKHLTIIFDCTVFEALVNAEDYSHEGKAGSVDHSNAVQHSLGVQSGDLSAHHGHAAHQSDEKPQLKSSGPRLRELVHSLS